MMPLARNIKRYFSLREIMIVSIAIIISIAAGVGVFLSLKRDVRINDNGKQIEVTTMKTTVKDVLAQNGISVKPEDYISIPLDSKLHKITTNTINIKRAVPVNLFADGKKTVLKTYKGTVGEALTASSVKLAKSDKLEGSTLNTPIVQGMDINVVRVNEELITEKDAIPFKTVNKDNSHMDKGKTKIVQKGKEGIREKIFRVVLENGKEIARELIKDSIALAPVNKIVEHGTIASFKTSRGENFRYKKVYEMKATAYTAAELGNNTTALGWKTRKGIIAVDPDVIPLRTKVYVENVNGSDYGYATAADVGGSIKGNKIDVYLDTLSEVNDWGRRAVKVYILYDE